MSPKDMVDEGLGCQRVTGPWKAIYIDHIVPYNRSGLLKHIEMGSMAQTLFVQLCVMMLHLGSQTVLGLAQHIL